jgi:hypothetical protein
MKSLLCALFTGVLLALCCAVPAGAEEIPATVPTLVPPSQADYATPAPTLPTITRELIVGDSGNDVYALKLRVQELGYFRKNADVSAKVTETTLERVNQLLVRNGMEPVETITIEIQRMIFSRDDLSVEPTPTPKPTPEPLIAPAGTPALPVLDREGFLAEVGGEYIYADAEDGLWYYVSNTLYINIRRYHDSQEENVWFETEIIVRGGEQLRSFLTDGLYSYEYPVDIARENGAVVAFTDDFFAKRRYGVAIRSGEIFRDSIRRTSTSYPIADTLAVFADGSMKAFDYNAHTAEEYLAMGAVDVLAFGPWLIMDGELNERVLSDKYMPYNEPRCAIGMLEPGHYVVITVNGRYKGAAGVRIRWLTWRMAEIGATEALNLDGGGTTALVFMGTQLSRAGTAESDGSNRRRVSSMLGFGYSDIVPN